MGVVGEHRAVQFPVLGVDGAGVSVQQTGDFGLVAHSGLIHGAAVSGMPIVFASRYSL